MLRGGFGMWYGRWYKGRKKVHETFIPARKHADIVTGINCLPV